MIPYWPTGIDQSISTDYSGGPTDTRAVFETIGGPITRPRVTGAPAVFSVNPFPMTQVEFAIFEAWVSDDLRSGALAFCLRDPLNNDPRMWKIMGGGETLYSTGMLGAVTVHVSLSLIRLPTRPWFAPYVPEGVSRVPDFVADYGEGVYGIAGKPVAASGLPSIAGDYLTVTTDASTVTRQSVTLAPGDIPSTAPAGVTSIIGFAE